MLKRLAPFFTGNCARFHIFDKIDRSTCNAIRENAQFSRQ